MSNKSGKIFVLSGNLAAVILFAIFAIWMLRYAPSLHYATREDGPVEYLSALLFGLSGIAFIAVIARGQYYKQRSEKWKYFFVICWIILMLFFMGEEISWGQRLLKFDSPEPIKVLNKQGEFNIHNLGLVHTIKYRALSIFILATGVLFPAIAATQLGKRVIQKLAFPVVPVAYIGFFVASYIYGKTFHVYDGTSDATAETRELFLALGMFLFALHGLFRPDDLLRIKDKG